MNILVKQRTVALGKKLDVFKSFDFEMDAIIHKALKNENINEIEKLLINEIGNNACEFISKHIDIKKNSTFYTSTSTRFNIEKINKEKYNNIVNLKKINDLRWVNKFFESVNSKLPIEGIFIGCVETKKNRKTKILSRFPKPINWFHYSIDFLFKRVAPKIIIVKKVYFHITKGRNRILTKAESLGRLVSCGFEIINTKEINNQTFFVVKKIKNPVYDMNPSYGPVFKMRRIGKDGKIIHVYKFRTMHPYSEYLQNYIIRNNGYDNEGKGKLKNDFRRTSYGKFLRRYWLDELPQIINILKGEMNIVGVRPLSLVRFNEFPDEVKKKRTKYKPGCFPPYVALLMPNEEDNIKAEEIYLAEKEKHPFLTDIKYFRLSVYNIVTNKIRSA